MGRAPTEILVNSLPPELQLRVREYLAKEEERLSAATEEERGSGSLTDDTSRGVEADDCGEETPDERLESFVAALNRFSPPKYSIEQREAIRAHCLKLAGICDRAAALIKRLKKERRLMPLAKPGQKATLPGGRVYAPELARLVKEAVSTDPAYLALYRNASEPPAVGTFLYILKRYQRKGLVTFIRQAPTISEHSDKRFLNIPEEAEDWLRANFRNYASARLTKFGEKWLGWARRAGIELPFTTHRPGKKGSCYAWLHRWRQAVPATAVTLATKGERGFEATYGYIIRDYSGLRPRDGWTMDWRQFDVAYWVPAKRGGGAAKLVREWLCPVIDLASVAVFGWVIEDRPNARGVTRAYLDGVRRSEWKSLPGMELLCGIQRKREGGEEPFAHFDNGKDFRSALMDGKEVKISRFDLEDGLVSTLTSYAVGLASEVGIRIKHAKVRNAKSKIVEPWFRYAVGLWEETLPGFCGNKTTEKPHFFAAAQRIHQAFMKRRDPKPADLKELPPLWLGVYERNKEKYGVGTPFLSEAEFRALFTAQMIKYLNEPHGRLWDEVGQMSPVEYLQQYADTPHMLTETTIEGLMMEPREVTVSRGEIVVKWGGEDFVYREVASDVSDGAALVRLPGEKPKVEFRFEAVKLGRALVMSGGRAVCRVECPPLLGWGASADDFKVAGQHKKRLREAAEEWFQVPKDWRDIAAERQEPQVAEMQIAVGAEDLQEPAPPRAEIIVPTRFDRVSNPVATARGTDRKAGPRLVTTEPSEPEPWEVATVEESGEPVESDDFEDYLKTF